MIDLYTPLHLFLMSHPSSFDVCLAVSVHQGQAIDFNNAPSGYSHYFAPSSIAVDAPLLGEIPKHDLRLQSARCSHQTSLEMWAIPRSGAQIIKINWRQRISTLAPFRAPSSLKSNRFSYIHRLSGMRHFPNARDTVHRSITHRIWIAALQTGGPGSPSRLCLQDNTARTSTREVVYLGASDETGQPYWGHHRL